MNKADKSHGTPPRKVKIHISKDNPPKIVISKKDNFKDDPTKKIESGNYRLAE
ncbi:hypothetical protein [Leptospira santarosai]|uniref:hypothetical protein n=1 Tax=Leptospira santarosai TaxID=28183 RepID=UPI0012BA837D|nr:hypothetical protein [Leptospira santarosai]MDI7198440.1 hypothetical protein [Leptospira santarosai]MDI7206979.1 hypothetical protein [Leptospira santarosai]MDO6395833.1 hypothetical protein [Leptospira santarosai]